MSNPNDSVNWPTQDTLQAWRHDFHRHPETAFQEHRTSARVAELLQGWGLEVHTGLAGTGIVAVLRGRRGDGPSIGLRADMDALHVHELNTCAHKSQHDGRMHACGHDGHTTMLLGAAQALASQPDFAGTVHFIFQPAEENEGGARAMIEDGLFQRFPMQAVYSLHNWPGLPVGTAAVHSEAVMAAFDIFDLTLTGQGCHAAMPHLGKDALLAACQLVTQLPALIAREQEVHKPAVLSITSFHAGDTYNVMPEVIQLRGTVRCFDMAQRARIEQRLRDAIVATCTLHGLQADLDYRVSYPATINHPVHAEVCAEVLAGVLGAEQVRRDLKPSMASEDFSFMAQACAGVYIWMGNGEDSASLHNPKYDFNDRVLPLGVQYFVQLVQALLRDGRLPAAA
ncbi:M20 aminoacylase family protein [Comamonas aquatica]|uniref:M20 aminoacylase family protein n=1 Tax=Comamonas aquatica TaxID=225991 RepID=UPI0024494FC6|nr:M20 family metallopeptidase [Comamonas aquatica]MDH0494060.1 M20 family metallopeptidase [Comamonas aquatica]MDH1675824.1 M20 family metallopeptidase [Comamonas aquatica]MDH1679169.1 M20 family metallopeptidase [Comamonas aquatica]